MVVYLRVYMHLKKRFVADGSSSTRVDERHRVEVCSREIWDFS